MRARPPRNRAARSIEPAAAPFLPRRANRLRTAMSSFRSTRRLIVLGSTGSIGVNTLAVVEHLRDACGVQFEVVGIAAGANAQMLRDQALRFDVSHVAIADASAAAHLGKAKHVYSG